eukprot:CAMPEP_0195138850 /NCGR_PEP_ID=MMETSP0448-20130528/158322_1 /TAXON_ID=66468 /ORGANISM="Heterocapsa triquestra, Strain CCMP 448" /LENGTH=52 /DNA_ID=CAMNT_0040177137 /DNA_START=39 /DNA_END=193 /DNA_ORIENTATION=+
MREALQDNIEEACHVRVVVQQGVEHRIAVEGVHAAPDVASSAVEERAKHTIA